ncbi:MAG: hypothetical protein ACERJ1_16655 [Halodesulfovibrio sp.]|uniref:hypothetical protein n=1 Tax=Halodesulfovibrio sp. TaxID=1912772 RepID=UPI00359D74CF
MSSVLLCPECVDRSLSGSQKAMFAQNVLMQVAQPTNDHIVCIDKQGRILDKYKDMVDRFPVLNFWFELLIDADKLQHSLISCTCDCLKELGLISLNSFDSDKVAVVTALAKYQDLVKSKGFLDVKIVRANEAAQLLSSPAPLAGFNFTFFETKLVHSLEKMLEMYSTSTLETEMNVSLSSYLEVAGIELKEGASGGVSETEKTIGIRDIVISYEGRNVSLVEAVRADSVSAKGINGNLVKHIDKAYDNYNPLLNRRVYQVVYFQGKDFDKQWGNYQKFLDKKYNVKKTCRCKKLVENTGAIKVISTQHGGIEMVHFFCKFNRKANPKPVDKAE